MKYPISILVLCAIACLPAHAQAPVGTTDSTSGVAAGGGVAAAAESDAEALKKKNRELEKSRDEKLKELEKVVFKDPANKQNRLALIDYLESLAKDSEKANDGFGAWRYYQRAAAALRDPKEDEWEQRAADDSKKAMEFREKATTNRLSDIRHEREQEIQRRQRESPGIVAPGFDWKGKQDNDHFAENRYREQVWKRIQSAWLTSEMRRSVADKSSFKRPVVMSFDVHKEGEISDITVINSCGDIRIDAAAMKVVEGLGKMEPLLPGMGTLVRFQIEFGKGN